MNIALPRTRRKARIEIIPLIDIIFFLLATFVLVSMSMVKNQGIPIRLPVATTAKVLERAEPLIIRVSKEGSISIDHKEYSPETLNAPLAAYKLGATDPKVILQGDTDAGYGKVIAVLDVVRKAGISKVAVQTASARS